MNDLYIMHSGVAHDENPPGRGSGRYAWGSKIVQTASSSKAATKQFDNITKNSNLGAQQAADIDRELRSLLSRRAYQRFKKNEKKYLPKYSTQELEEYVRRKRAEEAYVITKMQDDPKYNVMKTGEDYISTLTKAGITALAVTGSVFTTIVGIKVLSGMS